MSTEIERAIDIHQLTYKSGSTTIIHNLTSSVVKGAITTLIGPSGAGKTSLYKPFNFNY